MTLEQKIEIAAEQIEESLDIQFSDDKRQIRAVLSEFAKSVESGVDVNNTICLKNQNWRDCVKRSFFKHGCAGCENSQSLLMDSVNGVQASEATAILPLVVGNALLEELLSLQEEIICSPRRDVVITAESVKKVFEKHGIKWIPPF